MTRQFRKVAVAAASLTALASAGAVFAQAQSSPGAPEPAGMEQTTGPDTDNIQAGDQSTPDVAAARKAVHRATHARVHRQATAKVDTAQGTVPEQPGAENPEQSGEAPETAVDSDGPGGHADEPGNPNADTQQEGEY
jgi:hypothetical protein